MTIIPDSSISPRHGGHRLWAAAIAGIPAEHILDFSANLNPLGPPLSVMSALREAVWDPGSMAVAAYPDPDAWALRQVLAQQHGIPATGILVGNGAAELLNWAARESAVLEEIILPVPAFGDYVRALTAFGAKVKRVGIPLDLGGWALGSWLHPDSNSRSQALWLNHPHNPTGILWSREAILDLLPSYGLVVVDESFMDFLPPGSGEQSLIPWVQDYPQLVVIRSLTKFYTVPGLRLGYVVAHPERLRRWALWRDPWSVNGLAQVAGVAALKDLAFQEQTWAWLETARQHLQALTQEFVGWDPLPSAANFVLCRIPGSAETLQRDLLKQAGILIRTCTSYPELGDGYVRLAVRTIPEQCRLGEAMLALRSRGGDPSLVLRGIPLNPP